MFSNCGILHEYFFPSNLVVNGKLKKKQKKKGELGALCQLVTVWGLRGENIVTPLLIHVHVHVHLPYL